MDYRKDNWSYELECIRSAVRGKDDFVIEIADHYILERLENDQYPDRSFDQLDIAVAIFEGTIIEGYSSQDNRIRKSRVSGLVAPSRLIIGPSLKGDLIIVVISLLGSRVFKVVTCYPASPGHIKRLEDLKND